MTGEEQRQGFIIGDWCVHPEQNLLTRGKRNVRLEPRAMDLLVLLAERRGGIVSRDESMDRIWSGMSVTDDVLAQAVSKLRHALGDDRRNPVYIETIYKRGYRLVAPVRPLRGGDVADTAGRPAGLRRRVLRGLLLAGLVLAVLGVAVFLSRAPVDDSTPPRVASITRITSHPDNEAFPALSPDGRRLVFTREGEAGNGLFLLTIGEALPRRLTRSSGRDLRPNWDAAGDRIWFVRLRNDACSVMVLDLSTNGLQEAAPCEPGLYPDLDVHGESGRMALGQGAEGGRGPTAVHTLDGETSDWRQASHPPRTAWGDFDPAFDPTGGSIAFTRAATEAMHDLFILDLRTGEERRLTSYSRNILGHGWLSDGSRILASMRQLGAYGLWVLDTETGARQPFFLGAGDYQYPSVARDGARVVAVRREENTDLWLGGTSGETPKAIVESNGNETDATLSPDGERIAFVSNRGQGYELWLADADGTNERQVTSLGASLISTPEWSSSSEQLAFAVRREDRADLYTYRIADGLLRPLIRDGSTNLSPLFTEDGRAVLFVSDRHGAWSLYRYDFGTGDIRPVFGTGPAARAMAESESGDIYFSRFDEAGLFVLHEGAEDPSRLTDRLAVGDWANWRIAGGRILFLDRENSQIAALDLAGSEIRGLATLDQPLKQWDKTVSFSADGEQYLAAFITRRSSDLYLLAVE